MTQPPDLLDIEIVFAIFIGCFTYLLFGAEHIANTYRRTRKTYYFLFTARSDDYGQQKKTQIAERIKKNLLKKGYLARFEEFFLVQHHSFRVMLHSVDLVFCFLIDHVCIPYRLLKNYKAKHGGVSTQ